MKKGRIYTVHYGENIETTRQFIASIYPFLSKTLELVIINNSPESDLTNLSNNFIEVINADRNLGYFGAFKFGIEKTSLNNIDYIIISNNDIRIQNQDFFSILESKLQTYDIIGPSIITLDGIEQNPHRHSYPSLMRRCFYKLYYFNYFFAFVLTNLVLLKKKLAKNIVPPSIERDIISPHGAFIILNSSYFEKGGYIDDGTFLYGEEDSITAIALKNKLKIGFVPSLKIIHLESVTTGKGISNEKYKHKKNAYQYIKTKYPIIYSKNN